MNLRLPRVQALVSRSLCNPVCNIIYTAYDSFWSITHVEVWASGGGYGGVAVDLGLDLSSPNYWPIFLKDNRLTLFWLLISDPNIYNQHIPPKALRV